MNTETILKRTTSFRDDLLKDLAGTEFAMYYLEAALADYKEDGNTESIWMALRDVVEAQDAVSELSKRTGIDAETLSDALSNENVPRLDTLSTILNALECQLSVEHKNSSFNNRSGICIYCKTETSLNREHAFPDSLRQQNTPEWIIDKHTCKACNSNFGTQLDVVLSRRSPVAFIFDIIQRELGHKNEGLHSSPYHKQASGVNPIRMLFPNPVYDGLIVLHEPDSMNHQVNFLGVIALQPQMILTQYSEGQTCREVVEENNKKYDTKSLRNDNWYTHDEEDDVFCLFGNTHIFPPKTAHRYLNTVDAFKSKFMMDYPHTRYDLRVISPEVGRGEQKFIDFFNALQGESKQMIAEDKNLPIEVFRKPITAIMDRKGKSFFFRAIAKLAFHCFLCHYPNKYTGHETMFNPIKNFISRGSGMSTRFVKGAVTNEQIANCVYEDTEHQHFFGFFIKDKNIGCQIDLFTGLTSPPLSYGIVLAGDPDKIPLSTGCVKHFPFFVYPRSPLKKRIEPIKGKIGHPSEVGIIRPSKMSDLLWMRK